MSSKPKEPHWRGVNFFIFGMWKRGVKEGWAYHESDVGAILDRDVAGGQVVGDDRDVASHRRRRVGK